MLPCHCHDSVDAVPMQSHISNPLVLAVSNHSAVQNDTWTEASGPEYQIQSIMNVKPRLLVAPGPARFHDHRCSVKLVSQQLCHHQK